MVIVTWSPRIFLTLYVYMHGGVHNISDIWDYINCMPPSSVQNNKPAAWLCGRPRDDCYCLHAPKLSVAWFLPLKQFWLKPPAKIITFKTATLQDDKEIMLVILSFVNRSLWTCMRRILGWIVYPTLFWWMVGIYVNIALIHSVISQWCIILLFLSHIFR